MSLEFPAEVRFVGEAEFGGDGFVGPTFRDELLSETATKLSAPLTRRLAKTIGEEALQVPQGHWA